MSLKEFARKRFLIVDELDAFRFSTKKTLMGLGLKMIDTASNAQTVIAGFQNVNYDVILCNYALGKGKNGQELLEELRYRKLLKFNSLFFIISGEVEKNKVMGTIENEPDGYLVKPVTPQELQSRLAKALKIKEAMRLIDTAIDDGDFTAAVAYCDRKIAEDSKYTLRCLKTKAWLLTRLGDLDAAQQIHESVLKEQELVWAQYGLARIHIQRKRYAAAEALLRRIVEQMPDQVEALDLLAEIKRRQGETVEAQELVEQAIERSPNSLLRQKQHADICLANGATAGAIESFRKLVKLSDYSVYAKPQQFFDFARVLAQEAAAEADPEKSPLLREAAELLTKGCRRFESSANIEQQTRLVQANVNVILGKTEQAQAIVDSLLEQLEQSPPGDCDSETLQIAAEVYSRLGQGEKAEAMLEHAADLAGGDFERISSIYDQLNGAISRDIRQQAAQINKQGIRLYEAGQIAQAADQLRQAIPLTPRHISLNLNLIQVLLKQHRQHPDAALLDQARQCLHQVRHIPMEHREYKRYLFLRKKLEGSQADQ
jgi:tetratricopeptide (TPR) repeat protein